MTGLRATALLFFAVPAVFAQPAAGVSLSISNEVVPAGGVAQIKVFLTEPKPIIRTGVKATMDENYFDEFLGIAGGEGMHGVAQIRNGQLRVELSAPAPAAGNSDYPILTVAVRTRPGLAEGTSTPVALDLAASSWIGPSGRPYPAEAKPGSVTIGGSMFVSNVLPGGGILEPGEQFRVTGQGFAAGVDARAEGARLTSWTATELVMTAKRRMKLDGTRIRVELPNREMQTYFSYLRSAKVNPSADAALQGMVPVFSTSASLTALAPLAYRPAVVTAIGLQNPTGQPIHIEMDAIDVLGQSQRNGALDLGPRQSTLRSFEELLGGAVPANAYALIVRSTGAAQVTVAEVESSGADIRVPAVVILRGATY